MQRVKDVERFLHDLERPVPGIAGGSGPAVVSETDLEEDAASFMAFAGALGIKPPTARAPVNGDNVPSDLPSAPAS